MSDPKPRRLDQLLADPSGRLAGLAARARHLAAAERHAFNGLDPDLSSHCRLVGLEPDRAVVAVDSPAWATRLRYHTAQIREKLHAAGYPVAACRIVVVAPTTPGGDPASAPRPSMGPAAAASVAAAADGVGDAALAAALRKLSGNGRRQA